MLGEAEQERHDVKGRLALAQVHVVPGTCDKLPGRGAARGQRRSEQSNESSAFYDGCECVVQIEARTSRVFPALTPVSSLKRRWWSLQARKERARRGCWRSQARAPLPVLLGAGRGAPRADEEASAEHGTEGVLPRYAEGLREYRVGTRKRQQATSFAAGRGPLR